MNTNITALLKEIIEQFHLIDSSEIPNIPLYMDQVTTFMDEHLYTTKRTEQEKGKNKDNDKLLTKTMINNYAKNHLLPSPEKKRYSKEHIILLTFIYYFKNLMSMNDIKTILTELSDHYFSNTKGTTLEEIYEEISRLQQKDLDFIYKDISVKMELSREAFDFANSDEQDFLQIFSLICMLSFDIYVKKQLIESIIDTLT